MLSLFLCEQPHRKWTRPTQEVDSSHTGSGLVPHRKWTPESRLMMENHFSCGNFNRLQLALSTNVLQRETFYSESLSPCESLNSVTVLEETSCTHCVFVQFNDV